ncbi:hypothetical protein CHLRE_06g278116v5 [Chlamydomonas reinhardtii]|uniref:Cytidyltransferase-like domain-containing protein n=1 Tax=Chlamydomonas reinhardtii TaxID=3055 RepID=A0A2K3DNV8_CHLRE|nr:uncharacterized protein CHLRE_06g278116v5 [Chlamydomonas reinhardtii]PNW82224.1 hypothetical protein CHLRE_06g278116v5 [Chlamydomonas reinhardtii]
MRVLPKAQCASLRWAAAAPGSVRAASHAVRGPAAPQAVAQAQELPPDVESLIKRIHASRTKAVVYTTGGAVQSISWLLSVPGASATVLEAAVPYARDSLVEVLGGKEPAQFCSAGTAAAMAEAAYRRAAALSGFGDGIVGVGATCALATFPLKRGEHRAYVAVHGGGGRRCVSLTLSKGARSRVGEDDLVSRLLVKILAEASGVDAANFPLPLIGPQGEGAAAAAATATATAATTAAATTAAAATASPQAPDVLHDDCAAAGDPLQRLLAGEVRCVEYSGGGPSGAPAEVCVDAPRPGRVYLPGSFNPLHDGHKQLLATAVAAASKAAGRQLEGAFELTVENADKGLLGLDEIRARVAQFVAAGLPVVVTRAPRFNDKAGLLHAARFVVGYDTAVRLVMPKYHGDSLMQMLLDYSGFRHSGCSFVVAGRRDGASGRFLTLADVSVPTQMADLFPLGLTEADFRMDISSTELRQRAAAVKG